MINYLKKIFSILLLFSVLSVCAQDTLVLQPGWESGKDAIINDCMSDSNYGNASDLSANAWTVGGMAVISRSLFEFDLSIFTSNTRIVHASLSLYSQLSLFNGNHSTSGGSNEALLQRVTSNWDEIEVNWENCPSTTNINQVVLIESIKPDEHYLDIDVTALVQDMVTNPSTSYGFMFRLVTEEFYRRMLFASSDHYDGNLHPKLEIVYVVSD